LDLKQEFINISNSLDANSKTFSYFYLSAPTDEIPENVFIDIEFYQINIGKSNFTRIHSNAFKSTSQYTWRYYFNSEEPSKLRNIPPDYDFYLALSSLENSGEAYINLDSDIVHEIPDHAFGRTDNQLLNFRELWFNRNYSISRIGNYAFYSMVIIRSIDFNVNSILYISAHAFDFQFSNDYTLAINMFGVHLDETCLEDGIFQSPNRTLKINLSIDFDKYFFRKF
jgi:hypothetical protein